AYYANSGNLVLFGGNTPDILLNDTWLFNGTSWSRGSTTVPNWDVRCCPNRYTSVGTTAPPGFLAAATADYPPAGSLVRVAGLDPGNQPSNYTSLYSHTLGIDQWSGLYSVFGLLQPYDTCAAPPAPGDAVCPPSGLTARFASGMAYDAGRGNVVLFGG